MFFKKSKVEEVSLEKRKALDMVSELGHEGWALDKKAIDAYVKNAVIGCYLPGTSDYEKALKDATDAQRSVYNSIGHYDTKRHEIIEYINNHHLNLEIVVPITSHTRIEKAMERFLKK